MEKIKFNTGRKYAANGQPIVAVHIGDSVIFKDEARLIVGSFDLPAEQPLTQRAVMQAYDSYGYHMAAWRAEYDSEPEPKPEPAKAEKAVLWGLWVNVDGVDQLCECEDGVYYERAFDSEQDARLYAEVTNANYMTQSLANNWKVKDGGYFAAPIPSHITIPQEQPALEPEPEIGSEWFSLELSAYDTLKARFVAFAYENISYGLFSKAEKLAAEYLDRLDHRMESYPADSAGFWANVYFDRWKENIQSLKGEI